MERFHWERDQRRAAAAGVDVDKVAWSSAAELGRDIVGELAQQNRDTQIAQHRAALDAHLEDARAREQQRVTAANERRVTQAVAKLYQARVQRNVGDNTDPARFRQDLQQLADRGADHRLT